VWGSAIWGDRRVRDSSHVLVLDVLEQFQLAVRALGEDRCAERFHDLLDRGSRAGELVLCRAGSDQSTSQTAAREGLHQTRPKAPAKDEIVTTRVDSSTHPFRRAGGRHNGS
jgi:hypothetical protein